MRLLISGSWVRAPRWANTILQLHEIENQINLNDRVKRLFLFLPPSQILLKIKSGDWRRGLVG